MSPTRVILASSAVCWGLLCATHWWAGRSWTDLFAVGAVLTVSFSILAELLPAVAVVGAVLLNGAVLMWQAIFSARNDWEMWREHHRND